MISLDIFLFGLLIASTMTGLVTEAVKSVLKEHNIAYRANTLAGVVAVALSVALCVGYCILADICFDSKTAVCFVAMILMSWLCAMVGYDKVIQAVSQFKTSRGDK